MILLVDDEPALVKGLTLTFEREGFAVLTASNGEEALRVAIDGAVLPGADPASAVASATGAPTGAPVRPDVIILDLMLPVRSGLDVCRLLRSDPDPRVRGVPIIMLTARDDDIDKVVGLELGADDYVTKPFNSRELLARARAVLRRRDLDRASQPAGPTLPESGAAAESALIHFRDLTIDRFRRRVTVAGRPVGLTATEFDLLAFLAASPGRVYSREQLLSSVWGYEFAGEDRTVDVHVRRLREKIEPDPSRPVYVRTSWGRGYFFSDDLVADEPSGAPAGRTGHPGDPPADGAGSLPGHRPGGCPGPRPSDR